METNYKNMIIDIVVPTYNNPNLRKSLESLRRNTLPQNIGKVILIDQHEKYQEVDDLVDIHVKTKPLGFCKASNTGIRLSDAPYVMVLNDDVEFLNTHWVEGIEETFNRYDTALGVNPSSYRNPGSPGGECIEEWEHIENMTDEEYDKLVKELGKGWIIDGICTYATVFNRERLDRVKGVIPGKAWFDEYFYNGGEDYDLNRRAYMSGMRMLGTGLSYVLHWWYGSNDGKCNYSNKFNEKWGADAGIMGENGLQEVPTNLIR